MIGLGMFFQAGGLMVTADEGGLPGCRFPGYQAAAATVEFFVFCFGGFAMHFGSSKFPGFIFIGFVHFSRLKNDSFPQPFFDFKLIKL
jgi:hypothetical protein